MCMALTNLLCVASLQEHAIILIKNPRLTITPSPHHICMHASSVMYQAGRQTASVVSFCCKRSSPISTSRWNHPAQTKQTKQTNTLNHSMQHIIMIYFSNMSCESITTYHKLSSIAVARGRAKPLQHTMRLTSESSMLLKVAGQRQGCSDMQSSTSTRFLA